MYWYLIGHSFMTAFLFQSFPGSSCLLIFSYKLQNQFVCPRKKLLVFLLRLCSIYNLGKTVILILLNPRTQYIFSFRSSFVWCFKANGKSLIKVKRWRWLTVKHGRLNTRLTSLLYQNPAQVRVKRL